MELFEFLLLGTLLLLGCWSFGLLELVGFWRFCSYWGFLSLWAFGASRDLRASLRSGRFGGFGACGLAALLPRLSKKISVGMAHEALGGEPPRAKESIA